MSSFNPIKPILNYFWFVDPATPTDILGETGWVEYLRNILHNKELFPEFKNVLWTNNKDALPETVKKLQMLDFEIKDARDLTTSPEILSVIENYKKEYSALIIDTAKFLSIADGGIALDFNYHFKRKFNDDEMKSDFIFGAKSAGDVENFLLAADPHNDIVSSILPKLKNLFLVHEKYSMHRNPVYDIFIKVIEENKEPYWLRHNWKYGEVRYNIGIKAFLDGKDNAVTIANTEVERSYHKDGGKHTADNLNREELMQILNLPKLVEKPDFDPNKPIGGKLPLEYESNQGQIEKLIEKGADTKLLPQSDFERIFDLGTQSQSPIIIKAFASFDAKVQQFFLKAFDSNSINDLKTVELFIKYGAHFKCVPANYFHILEEAVTNSLFHLYKELINISHLGKDELHQLYESTLTKFHNDPKSTSLQESDSNKIMKDIAHLYEALDPWNMHTLYNHAVDKLKNLWSNDAQHDEAPSELPQICDNQHHNTSPDIIGKIDDKKH